VRTLEKGGEHSLLAEALSTHGIALARLRDLDRAKETLKRAVDVAQQAGDSESAGLATLVMIEQLGAHLSNEELTASVEQARELLKNSQDLSTFKRLVNCACRVLLLIHSSARFPASVDWTNFSVKDEVLRYEAHFLDLALKHSGGRVTRAARLLGLPGHQTLLSILTRHNNLLESRIPAIPRRRSIIGHRDVAKRSRKKASRKTRPLKILHVEDDRVVAGIVKETLAHEGWQVETCTDGSEAMKKLVSHARYDLLLLDYELPDVNGIQLVQQARKLPHRRSTPIVIFSGELDEAAARMAGADALLRKPEDISAVTETVARLVQTAKR
jgi:two-component system chemotaxis response regulator CheY